MIAKANILDGKGRVCSRGVMGMQRFIKIGVVERLRVIFMASYKGGILV